MTSTKTTKDRSQYSTIEDVDQIIAKIPAERFSSVLRTLVAERIFALEIVNATAPADRPYQSVGDLASRILDLEQAVRELLEAGTDPYERAAAEITLRAVVDDGVTLPEGWYRAQETYRRCYLCGQLINLDEEMFEEVAYQPRHVSCGHSAAQQEATA